MNGMMTTEQLATYLGMNEEVVRRMARRGLVPSYKISNRFRFYQLEIEEWIQKQRYAGELEMRKREEEIPEVYRQATASKLLTSKKMAEIYEVSPSYWSQFKKGKIKKGKKLGPDWREKMKERDELLAEQSLERNEAQEEGKANEESIVKATREALEAILKEYPTDFMAERLGVSESYLYWVRRGELKGRKLGKAWLQLRERAESKVVKEDETGTISKTIS